MNVNEVKFYRIKNEIRILGIDDAPFNFREKKTMLIGTIFRGGSWLDGILKTEIEVDGINATKKIISMVKKTKHKDLRVIMLDGLTFAGFNIVDIEEIFKKTKLPVIVIIRRMPDFKKIKIALKKMNDKENYFFRLKCIEKASIPRKIEIRKGKNIYIQYYGINFSDAKKIVRLSATRSLIPEPLRVAHLIATGISLGESRGRA
ncbi:MAG: DUF99 family protein [Candidatus Altiarchaeota archaeon]